MINPYSSLGAGLAFALLAYTLGWSELYPPLFIATLLFLTLNIVALVGMSFAVYRRKAIVFSALSDTGQFYPIATTLFIYLLWSIEFFHAGGIPLLKILFNLPYDYRTFGVPTLHVFVVTFSSFYTILLFHLYRSTRSRMVLTLYLINLAAALLIYNRGMLLFNLTASASIYLVEKQKLAVREVLGGLVVVMAVLYAFGALGTLRVSREAKTHYSNSHFLLIGRASDEFRTSIIPSEYFWAYVYLSSPIANLQTNINRTSEMNVTSENIFDWFNNEIMPDFLSKRINQAWSITPKDDHRIPGPFNATSVFSKSFSYLGWTGLILMSTVIFLIPVIFFFILPKSSPFFLTGLGILNTMFIFMVFDNTIRFTGLSFQLVYPILFHLVSRRVPIIKKIFVNNKVTSI